MRQARVLVAGLLAGLLLLAGAGNAWAVIDVYDLDGAKTSIDLTTYAPDFDVKDETYTLADGTTYTVHSGITLLALLKAMQLDQTAYGELTVQKDDGTFIRLTKEQVTQGFAGGMPVLFEDPAQPGKIGFLRPRGGTPAELVFGQLPSIRLREKVLNPLRVTLKASKTSIEKGQSVTFTATIGGQPPDGTDPDYSWYWDDGTTDTGKRTRTHTFTNAGSYGVLVTLIGAGVPDNVADGVTIKVGKPKKSDKNRTGGGDNDSAGAPATGSYDGGTTSGGGAPSAAAAAATPTPDAAPTPTPAPAPTPAEPTPTPQAAPSTAAPEQRLDQLPGAVVEVRGEVLSDPSGTVLVAAATPPTAAGAPVSVDTPSARTGTPQPKASHFTVPPAVWWLLLVALLLVAGWWTDNQRARAPRSIPPVP